jgi:glycosyltransferase involved in cell wall biosynthesis
MNILFLNSMNPDEFGGGEKWMIAAAKGLQSRGHRVTLAGKEKARFVKNAQQAALATVYLDIKGDFNPRAIWRIHSFLRQSRIEVLICNFNKDLRTGGFAARLAGTPLVLARHGLVLCEKKWKYKITLKYLADGIITNSRAIKDIYLSYGWFDESFIQVIHNGVEINAPSVSSDFKTQWANKKIILAAGRLTTQKGFSYLIDAVGLLNQKRNDFHLILAGDGALYQRHARQIDDMNLSEYITLTGHVRDMTPYLNGCDLVVLSSLYEGMPNIVLEAMAAGKAVVATDVHGVKELVQHKKTGLLVPVKNAEALMQAIDHLLNHPRERDSYGRQGLQRIKDQFSMETMITNLETYLMQAYDKQIRS